MAHPYLIAERADPVYGGTVLSAIPSISTTILGLVIGQFLLASRPTGAKIKMIASTGLTCLLIGYAVSGFIPPILNMWTRSYGAITAGWGSLTFLLFYWVIDVRAAGNGLSRSW